MQEDAGGRANTEAVPGSLSSLDDAAVGEHNGQVQNPVLHGSVSDGIRATVLF